VGARVPKLDPEKCQWEVMTPSSIQVFMSLVGVRVRKLDLEKNQWEVTTPSGPQIFASLVGVEVPKLDPKKSQWEVTIPNDLEIFHLWVCQLPSWTLKRASVRSQPHAVFKSSH